MSKWKIPRIANRTIEKEREKKKEEEMKTEWYEAKDREKGTKISCHFRFPRKCFVKLKVVHKKGL